MSRSEKQGLIVTVVLVGFLVSMVYHGALEGLGRSYPFTTFLYRPNDRFADLTRMATVGLDPYPRLEAGGGNAFPFFMLVSNGLLRFGATTGVAIQAGAYLIASFLWVASSIRGESMLARIRDVCILGLLGYPALFALDRANLELLQFVYLVAFLALYRWGKLNCAAVVLGLALATKPFVLPFVGLLLMDRAFRAAMLTIAVAVGVDFLALLAFDSPVATSLRAWGAHLFFYHLTYAVGDAGFTFGHSLFGFIKYLCYLLNPEVRPDERWVLVLPISATYTYLAGAIGTGLMGFLVVFRRTLFAWEKWVILLYCATALPYVSADYTLIHYLIPLGLFFRAPSVGLDRFAAVCFALLMVPKSFLHAPFNAELTEGVLVNPLIQTLLVLIVLARPIRAHRCKPRPAIPRSDTPAD